MTTSLRSQCHDRIQLRRLARRQIAEDQPVAEAHTKASTAGVTEKMTVIPL